MRKFDCCICGGTFDTKGDPEFHFGAEEMPEEETVSVCDNCFREAQPLNNFTVPDIIMSEEQAKALQKVIAEWWAKMNSLKCDNEEE